jgi:hypothetical protein
MRSDRTDAQEAIEIVALQNVEGQPLLRSSLDGLIRPRRSHQHRADGAHGRMQNRAKIRTDR